MLLDASKLSIKRCAAPARKRQSLTPRDDGNKKSPARTKPSGAVTLGGGAKTLRKKVHRCFRSTAAAMRTEGAAGCPAGSGWRWNAIALVGLEVC